MSALKMLSLDDIANADDLPTKIVDVPAWGGSVKVRMLTKAQQTSVRMLATRKDGTIDDEDLELGILVESVVEPQLTREHIQYLRNKNADVIDDILTEVFSMSALDKEALARTRDEFRDGSDEVDGVPSSEDSGDDKTADDAGADD